MPLINTPLSELHPLPFFSDLELETLHRQAAEYPLREILEHPRVLEERSYDYAYVNCKIAGNSYTQAGVGMLLKYGLTEGEKPVSDALMLVDIHKTFMFIMRNAQDKDVYATAFVEDLYAMSRMHQWLEDKKVVFRSHPSAPASHLSLSLPSAIECHQSLDDYMRILKRIKDPFEQAAYVHWHFASQQFFADDVNLISRLMETAILVHHNLVPVFMSEKDFVNDFNAVRNYGESKDHRAYAESFVRAYQYTIDHLLGRTPEQLQSIAEDEKRLQAAWAMRRSASRT